MPKYFSEKNKYVVDEPSLLTINGSVDILYAGGTEHKDGEFTILIGNTESYNPTEIETEPSPNPNPTPTEPDESEGGSGDDNEGGNSGGQESGGESGGGTTPVVPSGSTTLYFKLVNGCGNEVRLDGETILNIYNSPTSSERIEQNVHMYGAHSADWVSNRSELTIPVNESYTWYATVNAAYLNGNYYIQKDTAPYPDDYIGPLFIYSTYYNRDKQTKDHGNGMYFANIEETCKLQPNTENNPYIFTVYAMRSEALLANASTTISSLIESGKKYAILQPGQTSLPQ